MNKAELENVCDSFLATWNEQDPAKVVATYTADLVYRDPNTRGEVRGADAMQRYLKKLFTNWQMTWARRELFELAGGEGATGLWHATFRKPGGQLIVKAEGMDLVLLRGALIARNEVYFDRAVLAPLLGA